MPKSKLCKKAGCSRASIPGLDYCEKHKELQGQQRKIFTYRGKSSQWHHLYASAEWKSKSKDFLRRYPFCCICSRPAKITDHIEPHRGNLSLFWNENNWQPLCTSCHSRKTLAENNYFRKKPEE